MPDSRLCCRSARIMCSYSGTGKELETLNSTQCVASGGKLGGSSRLWPWYGIATVEHNTLPDFGWSTALAPRVTFTCSTTPIQRYSESHGRSGSVRRARTTTMRLWSIQTGANLVPKTLLPAWAQTSQTGEYQRQ